ncbi:MAG: PPOX class F420-dependent enzyme [Acidimicrobiia bacterium]|nr:MAG: PPOX class F420-dependent enzyme [Acidimicrobiia bacterium]
MQTAGVDVDAALEFVRSNHHAVLATRRRDGRPQMSPVLCAVEGGRTVVVSSRETAIKTRNVRRDPSVSLCVLTDAFFGEWVQLDGTAHVVSLPDAMEGLVEYYRRISGEHPDWGDYRAAMERERRCLIRVAVAAAGPDVSG